jgi:hypothetical protein
MGRFSLIALAILYIFAGTVFGTRTGDEDFGPDASGLFYVFAEKAVQIISPYNLTVVKNLTTDQSGDPLTSVGSVSGNSTTARSWNDAAFVEAIPLPNDWRHMQQNGTC